MALVSFQPPAALSVSVATKGLDRMHMMTILDTWQTTRKNLKAAKPGKKKKPVMPLFILVLFRMSDRADVLQSGHAALSSCWFQYYTKNSCAYEVCGDWVFALPKEASRRTVS